MTPHPQLEMDPLYGFSHALLAIAYATAFRGEVTGLENIPKQGGFILASNHASHLDPPFVGIGLLASRAQVPVIPARIFGSFTAFGKSGRLRLGTPISVTYGKPLQPADYDRPEDGKERYDRIAERIMAAISTLQPAPSSVI